MLTEEISKHLPVNAINDVDILFEKYPCKFKLAKPRKSKYGDFRVRYNKYKIRSFEISVNKNLKPGFFLLTLIHEMAHLVTYKIFERKVKPHGKEWQKIYKELMMPFINDKNYDSKTLKLLKNYFEKPCHSNKWQSDLIRLLEGKKDEGMERLEKIPDESYFELEGKKFQKGKKNRKRYTCKNLENQKYYTIPPHALVVYLK